MSDTKFKVGDRVRVYDPEDGGDDPKPLFGIVTSIDPTNLYDGAPMIGITLDEKIVGYPDETEWFEYDICLVEDDRE